MTSDQEAPPLGPDHFRIIQAAHARINDQPLFADQLVAACDDALGCALDLVGWLMVVQAEHKRARR